MSTALQCLSTQTHIVPTVMLNGISCSHCSLSYQPSSVSWPGPRAVGWRKPGMGGYGIKEDHRSGRCKKKKVVRVFFR